MVYVASGFRNTHMASVGGRKPHTWMTEIELYRGFERLPLMESLSAVRLLPASEN
jgi:hypothetical protein